MRVEMINPFISAASEVLRQEVQAEIQKGTLSIEESSFTSTDVTVMIGVTGMVQGIVMYGMSERTAKELVSRMMGEPIAVYDKMVESGIAEMGNVITGVASSELEKAGFTCTLAPPIVISGRGVIISTVTIKRIIIPLKTQYGDITIGVALREKK